MCVRICTYYYEVGHSYNNSDRISLVVQWDLATLANVPANVKGTNTRHNLYCIRKAFLFLDLRKKKKNKLKRK